MSVSSGNVGPDVSAKCSDSSIAEFRIVTIDTTDTTQDELVVKAATGSTVPLVGITLDNTDSADLNVTYRMYGIAKLRVLGNSDNISEGDLLVASTGGKGIKFSSPSGTTQFIIAQALAPSTADNDIIRVQIMMQNVTN